MPYAAPKPCAHADEKPGVRIRGRRGVALRARRLRLEPLCRDCHAKGRVTASEVPDHIVPIALGGLDTDENVRCLCKPCHAIRTAEQFEQQATAAAHVDGMPSDPRHPWNKATGGVVAR